MTWTAVAGATTITYTAQSSVTNPAFVWGPLTPVTDQGDVDFVYAISGNKPFVISSETARAIPILSSVISNP